MIVNRETFSKTSALHVPGVGRQLMVGFLSAIFNPQNAILYLSLFPGSIWLMKRSRGGA